MPEFIYRAKLEAEADKYTSLLTGRDERIAHHAFLAGAAAYVAFFDAETTEEWRHRRIDGNSEVGIYPGKLENRVMDWLQHEWMNESRRVLYGPWLPSEGGEKRG